MPLLYCPGTVLLTAVFWRPLNVCFIGADVVGDVRCHLALCLSLTEANSQCLMQRQVIDRVVHLWNSISAWNIFWLRRNWAYAIKYLWCEVVLCVVGHSMQVWGGKMMILPTTLTPWKSRVVKNTILYFCIKCPFNVRDTIVRYYFCFLAYLSTFLLCIRICTFLL